MHGVMLLLAVLAAPPASTPEALRQDSEYAFCHDERYPLTEREAAWCQLDLSGTCPSMAKACKAPRADIESIGGRWSTRRAAAGPQDPPKSRSRYHDANSRRRSAGRRNRDGQSGGEGSPLATFLFWTGLFVLVAYITFTIVVQREDRRWPDRREHDGAPNPVDPTRTGPLPAIKAAQRDVQKLLSAAQQALDGGDYDRAIELCHAAALRRLEGEGLLELHPSFTNGDYIRRLPRRSAERTELRAIIREIEAAQFGVEGSAQRHAPRVVERVRNFVRTLGASVLVLVSTSSLDGCGGAPSSHDWAHSPSGMAGLLELLSAGDVDASYFNGDLRDLSERQDFDTLLITDGVGLSEEEWTAVTEWVNAGHIAIVTNDSAPARFVTDTVEVAAGPIAIFYEDRDMVCELPAGPAFVVDWEDPSRFPVAIDRGERAAGLRFTEGAGQWIVVPDDMLFSNAGILIGGCYPIINELLAGQSTGLMVVDPSHISEAPTPSESFERSGLAPVVLHLLVFFALLALWRGAPFGQLREPHDELRGAFDQHVLAVGRLYSQGKAAEWVFLRYGEWLIETFKRRRGADGAISLNAIAVELARRSGREESELYMLLLAAKGDLSALDGRPPLAALRDLANLARALEKDS